MTEAKEEEAGLAGLVGQNRNMSSRWWLEPALVMMLFLITVVARNMAEVVDAPHGANGAYPEARRLSARACSGGRLGGGTAEPLQRCFS
jgi:hypothetical protein